MTTRGTTGNVVKLSHRNVAKLGGWDRILDAMGGMHWSSPLTGWKLGPLTGWKLGRS